tara:strand:+ start:572 stop:892 length:321 start_codon:yes stop_codon:yes gene_type:complete
MSDIDTIIGLTINGIETIDDASTAAIQVKIIFVPKILSINDPNGPFLPKIISKKKPTITGGIAKGIRIIKSRIDLPGIFVLVNTQPINIEIGKLIIVAVSATFTLK